MHRFCILFLGLILASAPDAISQVPYLHYANDIGNSSGGTQSRALALDVAGNNYVTGGFTSTTDFDPGPGVRNLVATSSSAIDGFVAKYNSSGSYLWAFSIPTVGGWVNAIHVDAANNVYITGMFTGSADFDPGAGTAIITSQGVGDIFIAKYTSAGTYQWAIGIGGAGRDEGFGIAVDGDGNVYVTGGFTGSVDFDPGPGVAAVTSLGVSDIFVSRYDNAGNYISAHGIGSTDQSLGYAITTDASNNVYVTGRFYGISDFDPGPGVANRVSNGAYDVFVVKYNQALGYQWAFSIGNLAGDEGLGIKIDGSGNICLTGSFQAGVDFDPGPGTAFMPLGGAFIAKYSPTGSYQWVVPFTVSGSGGNFGRSVSVDAAGNFYVTGEFFASSNFNPWGSAVTLTATSFWDVFVAKYNSAGQYQWAFSIGGFPGATTDIGRGIAADNLGNVFVTGHFRSDADFDPGAGTTILNAPVTEMFIAKYSVCPLPAAPGSISGNPSVCPGSSNTYSIPSFPGAVSYNWTLPPGWTGTSLTESINTIAGTSSGIISVSVTTACGATSSQTFSVTTSPVVTASVSIAANPPGPVCTGTNIIFTATAVNAGSAPFYQWKVNGINVGSGNPTYADNNLINGDIVSCTISNFNSCSINSTATSNEISMVVTASASPSLTILASSNGICRKTPVTFTAMPANTGTTPTYQWQLNGNNVGTNSTIYVNSDLLDGDRINCIMNTTTSCSSSPLVYSDTIIMIIKPLPVISFNPTMPMIRAGNSIQLNAIVPGGALNYLWTPSYGLNDTTISNPLAAPATTTIYKLNIIGSNACVAMDSIKVLVYNDIYIPNAFTPNNDGLNDVLKVIISVPVQDFRFIVFNRYGQRVFETTDVNEGWNGYFQGKLQPAGSFVYQLTYINFAGWKSIENGTVLLMR